MDDLGNILHSHNELGSQSPAEIYPVVHVGQVRQEFKLINHKENIPLFTGAPAERFLDRQIIDAFINRCQNRPDSHVIFNKQNPAAFPPHKLPDGKRTVFLEIPDQDFINQHSEF